MDATERAKLGKVQQLGYAVSELEPWIERYLAAGVGPWWVSRGMAPARFEYRGVRSAATFDVAISWSGDLMIELIRPADGHPSPYASYIAAVGEGLQHVAIFPTDAAAARASLEAAGNEVMLDGDSGGFHFTYYARPGAADAIEVADLSPEAQARLDAQREQCAAWDGSEPIRGR